MQWHLNAALTQFRAEVNATFPKRDKQSDGTVGDLAHQAGSSEHNPDPDGSVDAWDCDVDLDGTNDDHGPAAKIEALKQAFQAHPASQLWIHNGQIANRDVGKWKRRPYTGKNAHHRHIHFQSRPSQETNATPWRVDHILDAANVTVSSGKSKAGMKGTDVAFLQRWLGVDDDGKFGAKTEAAVKEYQKMRGITADGVVGKATWRNIGIKA
jgi:peptidoglycan hydrolase-like protein with peptidoglycan-binding domain